jgi:hypothetical protein
MIIALKFHHFLNVKLTLGVNNPRHGRPTAPQSQLFWPVSPGLSGRAGCQGEWDRAAATLIPAIFVGIRAATASEAAIPATNHHAHRAPDFPPRNQHKPIFWFAPVRRLRRGDPPGTIDRGNPRWPAALDRHG